MRRLLKLLAFIIFGAIVICAISFLTDRSNFGQWTIKSTRKDSAISWAKFYWVGDSLGGKYYQRTAMFIPAKMEGLPYTFSFQFDLGDGHTEIYETNLQSFVATYPELKNKIGKLKSPLQFWNSNKAVKDLTLHLGDLNVSTKNCFIHKNYGEVLSFNTAVDTFQIGTIGADVFRDKVLIIDYPTERFAICDTMPSAYTTDFIAIEIDAAGKPILPMTFRHKRYRIAFDNGSSLFPLMTLAKNIARFSTCPVIDTIKTSSWGQLHNVTGRLITDSFELAGQKFANVKIYSNESGLGIDHNTDGMAGNALFWDKVLIIDFKNKRLGVK